MQSEIAGVKGQTMEVDINIACHKKVMTGCMMTVKHKKKETHMTDKECCI